MTNNVHNFVCQQDIEEQTADWLARLDSSSPPQGEELAELKAWLNRSSAHRDCLRQLAEFWDQANVLTELSFPLRHDRRAEVAPADAGGPVAGFWVWAQSLSWQSAGATVMVFTLVFMLGVSAWLSDRWSGVHPSVAGNGVYETRIGEQNTITLVDGSTIQLNTNSRVEVDYTDARRTIVLMQGEAHFDVSKDPSRPFEVSAGLGRVRAVGTAFTVRFGGLLSQAVLEGAQPRALAVTVTEGKVALESLALAQELSSAEGGVSRSGSVATYPGAVQAVTEVPPLFVVIGTLTASQRVVYDPAQQQSLEGLVQTLSEQDLAQRLAWREGLLLFDGESLHQVVQELNRYTPVTIEIVDPEIADFAIGGQFKLSNPRAMLQAMALSFGIDVNEVGANRIQLRKSKGG